MSSTTAVRLLQSPGLLVKASMAVAVVAFFLPWVQVFGPLRVTRQT